MMAPQKHKKDFQQNLLPFLSVNYPNTHLIKALYSLDSSKSYGRLLEYSKTGASRDLFLPESDFKTSSAVNFSKKHPDFGGLETNQRQETQTRIFFICSSTYELIIT